MTAELRAVLICGNKPNLRTQLCATLGNRCADKSIILESDVDTALTVSQRLSPSLIVVDWDAFSITEVTVLLERLREFPRTAHIPAVIFTNRCTGDIAAIAIQFRVNMILLSGVNTQHISKNIDAMLREASQPNAFYTAINELNQARKKQDIGQYERAANRLIQQFPTKKRSRLEFATFCLTQGNISRAISQAKDVLRLDPENIRALNVIASANLKSQRYHNALQILETSSIFRGERMENVLVLCDGLLAIEQMKVSAAYFESTRKIENACTAARRGLAVLELPEADINIAISILREIENSTEIATLCNNIGIISARRGKISHAEAAYSVALRSTNLDTTKARIHFNLGLAFERHQIVDRAIDSYRTALGLDAQFEKCKVRLNACAPTFAEVASPFDFITPAASIPAASVPAQSQKPTRANTPSEFTQKRQEETSSDSDIPSFKGLPLRFLLKKGPSK
jgi:tetratricopeptide (TPR) repeat protein